jgi:transcriptional regulator with XRE-family HTH domain
MGLVRTAGDNIKRTRLAAGLSQEELARRAGLDRTYVSGVERAVRNPTLKVIERLAGALGTSASELLRIEKRDERKPSRRKV